MSIDSVLLLHSLLRMHYGRKVYAIAEQIAQKWHLCPNERLEVDVVGFTLGALVGDLRVLTK